MTEGVKFLQYKSLSKKLVQKIYMQIFSKSEASKERSYPNSHSMATNQGSTGNIVASSDPNQYFCVGKPNLVASNVPQYIPQHKRYSHIY